MLSRSMTGFLIGAVAAATYGMNPLFTLPVYHQGLTADSVLFYRYIFAALMLGLVMKMTHQSFALKRGEFIPVALAGLFFAGSSLTLFISYRHMDAGIASTILFVYPVMVALIMTTCFHEKITLPILCSIALALGGIALLYRGGDGATLSLTGVLLVLASSLSYAIYIVGVNRSSLKAMPSLKLTFYALLSGLSVYVIRLDFCTELQVIPTWSAWGNLAALALLPTVVSLLCTTVAIHRIGSTPTAILGALEPATAVFFGVTVFGEQLTPRLVTGIVLVIASVTLVVIGKANIRDRKTVEVSE